MRGTMWVAALAAVTTAYSCSGCPPTARTPTGSESDSAYPVTFRFDGGYAFIRDELKNSLTVASFHVAGEPDSATPSHELHMRLDMGELQKGPSPDGFMRTWGLDKHSYDISVAGYEDNRSGVTLPPEVAFDATDPCKAIAEDSREANNLSLMPIMNQLAGKAGFDATLDLTRTKYHNRVILTSGTMRIAKATSCFEFLSGATTIDKHRLPNGLGGVVVTFPLKGNLTLNISDETGATTPYEFAPAVNQATGVRQLDLWFGRFPSQCKENEPGCYVLKDQKLEDFERYYELLKTPPQPDKRVVLINRSEKGDVAPRSQCGSIMFNVK